MRPGWAGTRTYEDGMVRSGLTPDFGARSRIRPNGSEQIFSLLAQESELPSPTEQAGVLLGRREGGGKRRMYGRRGHERGAGDV